MNVSYDLLLVMLGGAIGSGARYSVAILFERWLAATHIGMATLTVNIVGCFFITLIAELAAAGSVGTQTRLFLNVGILGGLTTYSSFNHLLVEQLKEDKVGPAFLNLALTLVLCLASGFAGLAVARGVASK
ncbi:MAG TPA: CrcB family protein [Planctomycetota bacterium]|nr:CrcB family protein [Planctomycetota bacterium]